jgi:CubicO group peptidase (beta-lactamase class C family)
MEFLQMHRAMFSFLHLPVVLSLVISAGAIADETSALDASLATKVDAYVKPYVESNNFSGSLLIAKAGRIVLSRGYGMANYELGLPNSSRTRFHLASLSKTFTAAAILILQERGQLRVEDPLTKFIPDYPNGDKITVHHLLTHTSGIPNVNDLPGYDEKSRSQISLSEIIGTFKEKPLEFIPGSRYRYSNSNYNLLAFIIEKVSGKSYGEFLQENIFRPLHMSETSNDAGTGDLIPNRASGYVPVGMRDVENASYLNWSIKTGNGSLYSTIEDLYKWDRALYTEKLLKKQTLDKMFTDYGGFGYGWSVRKHFDRRVTGMTGRSPGFTSSLERFIDDDVCIVVAANTYSGITQSMADDLAAIVFEQKYEALHSPIKIDPSTLGSYIGRYQFGSDFTYNPGATVTVEKNGDQLLMQIPAGGTTYLIPQSETRFVDRLFGGVVSFQKDRSSAVTHLTWNFVKDFAAQKIEDAGKK